MFIDQKWKKGGEYNNQSNRPSNIGYIFVVIIFFIVGIVGVFSFLYYKNKNKQVITPFNIPQTASTSTRPSLPGELTGRNNQGKDYDINGEKLKIEEISFGHFYNKEEDDFISNFEDYKLPINIKKDVSNYYDISRKLAIDNEIDNLNNKGFTIVSGNKLDGANDFFSTYRLLLNKEIPTVVTNDYIFYYYQNKLKGIYKEIEKNVFYESLWDINKKMYDAAIIRYRSRLSKVGLANDSILEAQRLETAFFAVSLNLLSPTKEQINSEVNFTDAINKFTSQEADNYDYSLPLFLVDDVEKEVKLIRAAASKEKSPVMLYDRNYNDFIVPQDYKTNARLNNFYLATKWLNSLFPLYYLDDNCSDCLLDRDDWEVNMLFSSYMASDLSSDQDIKNKWAVIYKLMGFFKGLRQDLTYLYVLDALKSTFGEDFVIEDIFAKTNPTRKENFDLLQKKLLEYNFNSAKGAIERSEINKKIIGTKVLQDNYWPNEYIFGKITGNNMRAKELVDKTSCYNKEKEINRCKGEAKDIVNLINDEEKIDSISYPAYKPAILALRNEIYGFNNFEWNNNFYWFSLDEFSYIFDDYKDKQPVYKESDDWDIKKNYNTIKGAWVNLHLPEDVFEIYEDKSAAKSLVSGGHCNSYTYYIDTDTNLIRELISKNKMLSEMLSVLGIGEKTNLPSSELSDLTEIFNYILDLQKKELSNIAFDYDDCRFVRNFITSKVVANAVKKEIEISDNILNQKLSGVKLLLLIYNFDGKNVLAIGPIFNQEE